MYVFATHLSEFISHLDLANDVNKKRQIQVQVNKKSANHLFFNPSELDMGMQGYYGADMAMDGMDGGLLPEDYPGNLPYERQPYA